MQNKHFKKIEEEEEDRRFFEKLDRRRHAKEALKGFLWLYLIACAIYVTSYWDEFIENPLFFLLGILGPTLIMFIVYYILDSY